MAEYSRSAKGSFTQSATGNAVAINLPFQPSLVKLTNYTAFAGFAYHDIPWATWDVIMGQGTAAVGYVGSGPVLQVGVVATQGISTFAGGISLQLGAQLQISGITKASPAVVTTASAHGLASGQVVILEGLYQSSTTGMPQISGMPFTVTVTAPTTFTIPWNTSQSNYTALSGSPTGAYVRQVLFPYLYTPGVSYISAITTGATTTVTTTDSHNFVVGQEIGFRIPSVYGTTQLNTLPNNLIPGSPVYYYVTSVTGNNSFVCNANSSAASAFNSNQPVASVSGLQLPQVFAMGDVNTGGWPYTGGALYPSPAFPTYTGGVPTINGPALQGAFVNNTSQGFIIGAGNAVIATSADTSSYLSGATSDQIFWEAYLTDYSSP